MGRKYGPTEHPRRDEIAAEPAAGWSVCRGALTAELALRGVNVV